ncbi:hypothetical protein [Amycolatopsis sp. NPDC051903]|uniref:hypothetical protein n=1 Tax=Amycolatopsis sp. NPDC051903 TaxID=3363936 RepID=UPI0037A057C3
MQIFIAAGTNAAHFLTILFIRLTAFLMSFLRLRVEARLWITRTASSVETELIAGLNPPVTAG